MSFSRAATPGTIASTWSTHAIGAARRPAGWTTERLAGPYRHVTFQPSAATVFRSGVREAPATLRITTSGPYRAGAAVPPPRSPARAGSLERRGRARRSAAARARGASEDRQDLLIVLHSRRSGRPCRSARTGPSGGDGGTRFGSRS